MEMTRAECDTLAVQDLDALYALFTPLTAQFTEAECDVRMVKVQQKVSGTFRDERGANACCRIRGYLSTLRKQGHALLSVLDQTMAGQPPMPCLLPPA